jgi:hypothetical protein
MKRTAISLMLLCGACSDSGTAEGDTTATTDVTATMDDGGTSTAPATTGPSSSGADDTGDTGSSDDGVDTTGGTTGPTGNGCEGTLLRDKPADPSARGPWPVGARTVTLGDLTVEVWYPAVPGSEAGGEPVVYDIREQLPASEQDLISDADNPWQPCDCTRDLPVDEEYGPYPAIVFVHGTASFRTQSLPQMVHWASRGFVVLAADHPGLRLGDTLGSLCGAGMVPQDLSGDVQTILSAVRGETAGLEFLGDRVDGSRIGMAGHSAGGNAISGFGGEAQVLVPMAAGGTDPGAALLSTLVLGGTADSVVAYGQQMNGYASSPSPKRFVGIAEAGHLTFSEICSLENEAGDDLLTIANDNGVCGAQLAGFLFQCSPDLIADADGWALIDYATAAVFEETLHCTDAEAIFAGIEAAYPYLVDFAQD